MLRNIFGHKGDAVKQNWRKLHSEGFRNLYWSSSWDTVLFSRCSFNDAASIYDHTASKAIIFKRLYQKYEKGESVERKGQSDICLATFWGRNSGADPDADLGEAASRGTEWTPLYHSAQVSSGGTAPGLYSGGARFESLPQRTVLRHTFSKFSSLPLDNRSYCIPFLKIPRKMYFSERM